MGKLKASPESYGTYGRELVGTSPAMDRLRRLIERVAERRCTVLVEGPSGSGKELVARQIHRLSRRRQGPLVPVDCTTLRDTLFESQLFGHVRGAFTGADRDSLGFIRAADTGTLFLDEIGELPIAAQSKLLRCMQEGVVVPVGSTKPVRVDVRVLAATHRNLESMVRKGEFRADLFFRLHVVKLRVPSLRQRKEDIPLLVEHLLHRLSNVYEEPQRRFEDRALRQMMTYDWPGNVRELANAVEHAFVMSVDRLIPAEALPEYVTAEAGSGVGTEGMGVVPLEAAQRQLVINALKATEGHQGRAAQLLQVERRRFYRLVQRYDIDPRNLRD